jgi:c-di-GMP phosphodiesterase
MSDSILDSLTLGYRLLWNRRRELAGVELLVDAQAPAAGVDARHLLAALAEGWPARGPQLLLTLRTPGLLPDLLRHAVPEGPWIVLPAPALADNAALRLQAEQAQARGLRLVWPGRTGTATPGLWLLDAGDSADALPPGQILDAPTRRAQAAAALDQREAWAVAGWPVDDTLRELAPGARLPDRTGISRVVRAIEQDASLDRIEALLAAEPVLSYRFLQHVNATAVRQRGEIDTVQRGLQVWGLQPVQAWLLDQLAQAAAEPDLQAVRTTMGLYARLAAQLLDPGDEEDLRREVELCALYAGLDRLLGEPLPALLSRLPLSQRILQALLERSGPYHPALQIAQAMQAADLRAVRALCESYGYAPQQVNRALLRTLTAPSP